METLTWIAHVYISKGAVYKVGPYHFNNSDFRDRFIRGQWKDWLVMMVNKRDAFCR